MSDNEEGLGDAESASSENSDIDGGFSQSRKSRKRQASEAFLSSDEESDGSDGEDESESEDDDDDDGDDEDDDDEGSDMEDVDDVQVAEEEADSCAICLMGFTDQQLGTPESCKHTFCLLCIQEWSNNVNTCPVDRKPFRKILVRATINGPAMSEVPVQDRLQEKLLEEQTEIPPTFCEVCHQCDREDQLLLCDDCDNGYHLNCLTPVLDAVPDDEWYCPDCQPESEHEEEMPSSKQQADRFLLDGVSRRTRRTERRSGSFIVDDDDDDDDEEEEEPVTTRSQSSSSTRGRGGRRGRAAGSSRRGSSSSTDRAGTSRTGRARTVASTRQQSATRGRPATRSRGRSSSRGTTRGRRKSSGSTRRKKTKGKTKRKTKRKTKGKTKGKGRRVTKKAKTEKVRKRPDVQERVFKQFSGSAAPSGSDLTRLATRCPFPSRMEPTLSFSVFGNDMSLEYMRSSSEEEEENSQVYRTRASASSNPDVLGGILEGLETLHNAESVDRKGKLQRKYEKKGGKAKEKRRYRVIESDSSSSEETKNDLFRDKNDIFTAEDDSDDAQPKRSDDGSRSSISSSSFSGDVRQSSESVTSDVNYSLKLEKPESSPRTQVRERPRADKRKPSSFNPFSFKIPKKVRFHVENSENEEESDVLSKNDESSRGEQQSEQVQPENSLGAISNELSNSSLNKAKTNVRVKIEQQEQESKKEKVNNHASALLSEACADKPATLPSADKLSESTYAQQRKNLAIMQSFRKKTSDMKDKIVKKESVGSEQNSSRSTTSYAASQDSRLLQSKISDIKDRIVKKESVGGEQKSRPISAVKWKIPKVEKTKEVITVSEETIPTIVNKPSKAQRQEKIKAVVSADVARTQSLANPISSLLKSSSSLRTSIVKDKPQTALKNIKTESAVKDKYHAVSKSEQDETLAKETLANYRSKTPSVSSPSSALVKTELSSPARYIEMKRSFSGSATVTKPPETVTIRPTQMFRDSSQTSSDTASNSNLLYRGISKHAKDLGATSLGSNLTNPSHSESSVKTSYQEARPLYSGKDKLVDTVKQQPFDLRKPTSTWSFKETESNTRSTGSPSSLSRTASYKQYPGTSYSGSRGNTGLVPSLLRQSPLGVRVTTPPVAVVAPSRHDAHDVTARDSVNLEKKDDASAKRTQGIARLKVMEEASTEVKIALKPYYRHAEIDKEEYKHILKKSVDKILEVGLRPSRDSVQILVKKYVKRIKGMRQTSSAVK